MPIPCKRKRKIKALQQGKREGSSMPHENILLLPKTFQRKLRRSTNTKQMRRSQSKLILSNKIDTSLNKERGKKSTINPNYKSNIQELEEFRIELGSACLREDFDIHRAPLRHQYIVLPSYLGAFYTTVS